MKAGARMDLEKRKRIQELLESGMSPANIANEVGVWKTTVYRDFKRCKGKYNAEEAQSNSYHGFRPIDWTIVGKKFGLLTIKNYINTDKNRRTWWNAVCDCGNETKISRKVLGDYVSPKRPLSCGCIAKEHAGGGRKVPFEEACLRKYQDLLNFRQIEGECWIYTGYSQGGKIPKTSWKNKVVSVRKCMYLITHDSFYEPNHTYATCRNRLCFNPDHIALGRPPNRYWYE